MNIAELLRRLFTTGSLTIVGHILALLLFPLAMRELSSEQVASIGLIDSTIMLVVSLLGFGLNATGTRDMVLAGEWRQSLVQIQSARITAAIPVSLIGFTLILMGVGTPEIGWILLFSPVFALNYDFALYSRGKPDWAAAVSLVRQAIPLIIFFSLMYLGWANASIYLLLMVVFVFVCSFIVSRILGSQLLFAPRKSFYKSYWAALPVGVSGLILIFQRYGFLSYVSPHLSSKEFVYLATSLKFYLFFIAIRRLLVQVFYTHLLDCKIRRMLDSLGFAISFVALLLGVMMSKELSLLIFNNPDASDYVIGLSLLACCTLFFAMSDAILLLERKDKWMLISNIISGVGFIAGLTYGTYFFDRGIDFIYLLIAAELALALLYKIGVHFSASSPSRGVEA